MIAVILAAGAGRRLGGVAKALLPVPGGHTFLSAIAESAAFAGVGDIVVVVGPPFAAEVATHARALALEVAVNPAPERGMASSVEVGFAWAQSHASDDSALLWPVDHPSVSPRVVADLGTGLGDEAVVAIPSFRGRSGHPVLCARSLWPELAACSEEDEGARSVMRRHRDGTVWIPVSEPGVIRDVDTPEALEELGCS